MAGMDGSVCLVSSVRIRQLLHQVTLVQPNDRITLLFIYLVCVCACWEGGYCLGAVNRHMYSVLTSLL